MRFKTKVLVLIFFTAISIVAAFEIKEQSQSLSFHHFADTTTCFGILNFVNVISNLPFLIIGITGLLAVGRSVATREIKLIYHILFTGIIFTSFGSASYHLYPDNGSLVWDRIPMTIVFMAFLTATLTELVHTRLAHLLIPLCTLGIYSVFYWQQTELLGRGDLRVYGFVQFYPMLLIPLIMVLFRAAIKKEALVNFIWIMLFYLLAKIFEHFDRQVYNLTGVISGHSLKHFAAALSCWNIVSLYKHKHMTAFAKGD